MNDKINISKGDIPETDAEVEKMLAKKKPTTKRKLALVQTPVAPETPEKEAEKENAPPPVIQPMKTVFMHNTIAGVDCYSYDTQSILDTVDAAYKFYGVAPIVQISGDVLVEGKPARLNQELAEHVEGDTWRCPYSDITVAPLTSTFVKCRIASVKHDMLEKWEASQGRVAYRKKLLDTLRIS